MGIITVTLKSTSLYVLPVLCKLEPPTIRKNEKCMKEFNKLSSHPDLLINDDIRNNEFNQLKSINPPAKLNESLKRGSVQP